MSHPTFNLAAAARQEMIDHGFDPDFSPDVARQVAALKTQTAPAVNMDLRAMLWSSIDNDTSRDLDQAEAAEHVNGGTRVLIAIADVDARVPIDSPIDRHAAAQTTTVYTGVQTFSMLPEQLSTDLTSLNENSDRAAVIVEMIATGEGSISSSKIYRALVRNHAQLSYNGIGAWLEGASAAPQKLLGSADLQAQLKLQDEASQSLRAERRRLGALDFDRVEAEPIMSDGQVQSIATQRRNRASELIEDFMVAANEAMAQTLMRAGVPSIRRIVKTPERWPRIVELREPLWGKASRCARFGCVERVPK